MFLSQTLLFLTPPDRQNVSAMRWISPATVSFPTPSAGSRTAKGNAMFTTRERLAWRLMRFGVVLLLLAVAPNAGSLCEASEEDQAGIEFFEKHIRPVLVQQCYECHAAEADSIMGGLRVDRREGLLKGGDHGAAVVPKDVEKSLLITHSGNRNLRCPPKADCRMRRFSTSCSGCGWGHPCRSPKRLQ